MYKRKRRGLKIEPCGASQIILPGVESSFLTLTEKYLFVRYNLTHKMVESENSRQVIFSSRISYQGCRNLFTDQSESFLSLGPFSKPFWILLLRYDRQVSVE